MNVSGSKHDQPIAPDRIAAAKLWNHPVLREWLVIALLLTMFVLFSLRGDWFSRIEQTAYDQALSLWQRPAQADIVVIAIDDDSVQQLGRWPWPRVIHAKLLEKLTEANVKAIALDVVLSEPDKQDGLLADALRANGKVVLPLGQKISEGVPVGEALPSPPLAFAAARFGHVSAQFDSDGVVRRTFLRAGFRAPRIDLLGVAALEIAEPDRAANIAVLRHKNRAENLVLSSSAVWAYDGEYRIPFAGGAGHFKRVSYIDVLRGDLSADTLKNKIVLVGMTIAGGGDEFPTPLSGDGSVNASGQSQEARAMPGVEIHANVIQGLREGINISEASFASTATISLILVLGLLAAFLWLTPSQSIILTAVSCVTVIVGSAVLFRLGQLWISPMVAFMAMVLAYPLWSWRKLQATQRYFDEELSRLQLERSVVSPETARTILPQFAAAAFMPDVVEQRIASVRDATQRLRNLNRFVADSLESLPEAALVTDFSGRVMLANSSADRLLGSHHPKRNELAQVIDQPLEGRDVFDLMQNFKHDGDHTWRELWADASDNSRSISIEARMVGKGADDLEFLVQIAPSMSHTGAHTGTILTLTDISPLRDSERRRDEALRFLSHDMRSPQASIITLLEMQRDDPDSMTFEKLMERIDRYAKRTLNLADDFLRLAKAERSKPQDFAPLELSGLLQDAVEEAWSLASAKQISVKSNTPDDEAWVAGDRDLLTRVLMNLLSNAIKYSPANTMVTCSLRREEKNWVIDVADQGYGISEANMSKLFTRFVRLHEEGQPEEEGIGLGLVFVKTVVTRHNGTIGVKSQVAKYASDDANTATLESTDHGTTFSVTLPAQDAPED